MKHVDGKRLGRSYGFHVITRTAYNTSECRTILEDYKENDCFDAVVLHLGVNDLKKKDATDCSDSLVVCVEEIQSKWPKASIVVSKVAPLTVPDLKVKRELFNAHSFSLLHDHDNTTFLCHENLKANISKYIKDGIHPSYRGTSVLAGNLGRHLHTLLWKKPTGRGHRRVYNTRNTQSDHRVSPQEDPRLSSRPAAKSSFTYPGHFPSHVPFYNYSSQGCIPQSRSNYPRQSWNRNYNSQNYWHYTRSGLYSRW